MTIYPETVILQGTDRYVKYVGEDIELPCEVQNHTIWQESYDGTISWQKSIQGESRPLSSARYIMENKALKIKR